MVGRNFDKSTETSSSSYIPLSTRSRKQQKPRNTSSKKPGTPESGVPRKPINLLRMQNPKYKKMSRKNIFEILMKELNPNAGESIEVDIKSDIDEIDEAYDSIRKESPLL